MNSGCANISLRRARWRDACWARLGLLTVLVLAMLPISVSFAHCVPLDATGEGNFPEESRAEDVPEASSITRSRQRRARRHWAALSLHVPLHVGRAGAEVLADASSTVFVFSPTVHASPAAGSFTLRC